MASKTQTVLFYNHGGTVSGAETVLLDLLAGLARPAAPPATPLRVILVCPQEGPLWERAGRLPGIERRTIRPLTVGYTKNPLVAIGYLWQLLRVGLRLVWLTRRNKVEIVQANSIRGGLVACLVRPVLGARVVVHLHDALGQSSVDRLIRRIFGGLAWRLVAISDYVREASLAGGPYLAAKCRTIPNGVALQHFDPARFDRPAERARLEANWPGLADLRETSGEATGPQLWPLLAMVGQITPWKGQAEAVEALAFVRQSFPRAGLLIVGGLKFALKSARYDNRAYKARLDHLIEEKGLGRAVWFCGEREDVAPTLAGIDLVLVPSWAEPFGRVVIEAMALERPVIATEVGGPSEIIVSGQSGRLVPPRDPQKLAQAITDLLAPPDRLAQIGQAARRRVQEQFSSESMVKGFQDLYRELS